MFEIMKTNLLSWCAGALLVTGLLGAFIANAADPAATPPAGGPPAGGGNQPGGGRGGFGGGNQAGGRGGFGGAGALGMDDKQRELYREATEKNTNDLAVLAEKLLVAQKELVNAVLAEKYEEKVVREKAEVVAKIQTDMLMLRSKAMSTLAPTLKPEQRDTLNNPRIGFAMLSGGFGAGVGGNFGGGRFGAGGNNGNGNNGNNGNGAGGAGFRGGGNGAGGAGAPGGGAPGGGGRQRGGRGGQGGQPPAQ